jgi:TolA-binding protein
MAKFDEGPPGGETLTKRVVELSRPHLEPTELELAALARVERQVLARLEAGAAPRGGARPRWPLPIGIAAAAGLALVVGLSVRRAAPPARPAAPPFVVSGAAELGAGVVRAPGPASAAMRFVAGSELVLSGGSEAQVTALDDRGRSARVRLRRGHARARVVHQRGTRWTVEAGPFSVRVTGTTFDVDWAPESERFEVRLEQGAVEVTGPLLQGGVKLRASNTLVVDLPTGLVSLRAAEEAPPPPAAPARPPHAAAARAAAPAPRAPAPRRAGRARAEGWGAALAAGRFREIVRAAEDAGIPRVLAERPVDDLLALADAARFTRRYELAREALAALRTRAPGSRQAADAGFFLGWLADEQGAGEEALRHFERYVAGHPTGAYVEQALGRRLLLVARLRGRRAAAPLADDYLRRFPAGAHAEAARALRPS